MLTYVVFSVKSTQLLLRGANKLLSLSAKPDPWTRKGIHCQEWRYRLEDDKQTWL